MLIISVTFTEEYLEHKDISAFSMDFSPYGKNDAAELATTARVSIDAEYGKTYTIIFSGDQESGFSAKLQEQARAGTAQQSGFGSIKKFKKMEFGA